MPSTRDKILDTKYQISTTTSGMVCRTSRQNRKRLQLKTVYRSVRCRTNWYCRCHVLWKTLKFMQNRSIRHERSRTYNEKSKRMRLLLQLYGAHGNATATFDVLRTYRFVQQVHRWPVVAVWVTTVACVSRKLRHALNCSPCQRTCVCFLSVSGKSRSRWKQTKLTSEILRKCAIKNIFCWIEVRNPV